jgi:hypothetical protein
MRTLRVCYRLIKEKRIFVLRMLSPIEEQKKIETKKTKAT